jgi:hypothetical protein
MNASGVYIAFTTFAMVFLLIVTILMLLAAFKPAAAGHGIAVAIIVLLALSMAAHLIAFAVWHGVADIQMSDN